MSRALQCPIARRSNSRGIIVSLNSGTKRIGRGSAARIRTWRARYGGFFPERVVFQKPRDQLRVQCVARLMRDDPRLQGTANQRQISK